MPYELDEADRRILRELQQDGVLRNDVLAERIALTPAPTLRRVRALEKAGVISRYTALLACRAGEGRRAAGVSDAQRH